MSNEASVRPGQLILVPAIITLAVTLLRLVGELQGWSPRLFSKEAGGGGSLVGISWLVPVFGAWFGWKLARSGERPGSLGRALGLTILALAILPASGFVAGRLGVEQRSMTTLAIFAVVSVAGLLVALLAWPALGRVLLAYGLAARIPVVLVMLVAILGNWGTHYDVPPPKSPADGTAVEVARHRRPAADDRLALVHRGDRRARRHRGRRDRQALAPRHAPATGPRGRPRRSFRGCGGRPPGPKLAPQARGGPT